MNQFEQPPKTHFDHTRTQGAPEGVIEIKVRNPFFAERDAQQNSLNTLMEKSNQRTEKALSRLVMGGENITSIHKKTRYAKTR